MNVEETLHLITCIYGSNPYSPTKNKTMEDIGFAFLGYTNFLNANYKIFGDDWIRFLDDKIIYNITEILEDFKTQRPDLWQSK